MIAGAAAVVAWSSAATPPRTPQQVTIYRSLGGAAFTAITVQTGVSGTYIDMNGPALALSKAPPIGPITDWFNVTVTGSVTNPALGAIAGTDGSTMFVLSGTVGGTQFMTLTTSGVGSTVAALASTGDTFTYGAVASAQWVSSQPPPPSLVFTSGTKLAIETNDAIASPTASLSVNTNDQMGCSTASASSATAITLYTFAGANSNVNTVAITLPRTAAAAVPTTTAFPDYALPACLDADGRFFVAGGYESTQGTTPTTTLQTLVL